MRLSIISRILIVKDKVCVTHQSRRLRLITQTEALIVIDIMRKTNSIIVNLLCIQNQKTKNNTNGTHKNFIQHSFFNVLSMQQCF